MKRWRVILGIGGLFAALAGAVLAQTGAPVNPTPGSVWTYLGPTYGASWVFPFGQQFGWVPNNAALAALVSTQKQVYRAGFYAEGDGGAAMYTRTSTPCSLNGGVGDNGSQVKAIDGGCWIADFSGTQPTPLIWGARGDGTTDDRVQVQAAINALAGHALYIGGKRYCLSAPGITVTKTIGIYGDAPGFWKPASPAGPKPGFVACTANMNILTYTQGGDGSQPNGSILSNVFFDATAFTNTSGAAITQYKTEYMKGEFLSIDGACIGIDEQQSNSNAYTKAFIRAAGASPGGICGGVRVGAQSTQGNTVDLHLDTITQEGKSDYGVLILDAGGMFINNSDLLFSFYGTHINPGANQSVVWLFANNTVLGDSTCGEGIKINTSHPSASVSGLLFTGAWASTAGHADTPGFTGCNAPGVAITNDGGGTIRGIAFNGLRAFNNGREGVLITTGAVYGISIDNSIICNNSINTFFTPGTQYAGIAISESVNDVTIRGNRFGDCTSSTLHYQEKAVFTYGNNTRLMITNNDFTNMADPLGGFGQLVGDNVITFNGPNKPVSNVTAGSLITLGLYEMYAIIGTTGTINNIANMWTNREVYLLARDQPQNFAPGTGAGRICNTVSMPVFSIVKAIAFPGTTCVYVFPP